MINRSTARWGISLLFGLGVLATAGGVLAATGISGQPNASIGSAVNDDLFAAGQSVSVTAPVHGELFAAGETVAVSNRPDRSVFAGGQTISLSNGSGYDAFLGGQTVTVSGDVGHDVYAAGSSVVVEPGSHIHGSLFLAGSTLTIHGTVDGQVHASGQTVSSDAVIGQDVAVQASSLSFSGGSIGGSLRYQTPSVASGINSVAVHGSTTHESPKSATTGSNQADRFSIAGALATMLLAFLTMVLVGALGVWVAPQRVASVVAEVVGGSWVSSFLTGLVALVVMPLLASIAFATLIGWPVALAILATYAVGLIVSAFLAPILLGSLMLKADEDARPWRQLFLGALIVAIATSLPIAGGFVRIALFIGLTLPAFGATLRWAWNSVRS